MLVPFSCDNCECSRPRAYLLFIERKCDQDHLVTAGECPNNNQASGVFLSVWSVITPQMA